jgi:hypothetical protein
VFYLQETHRETLCPTVPSRLWGFFMLARINMKSIGCDDKTIRGAVARKKMNPLGFAMTVSGLNIIKKQRQNYFA